MFSKTPKKLIIINKPILSLIIFPVTSNHNLMWWFVYPSLLVSRYWFNVSLWLNNSWGFNNQTYFYCTVKYMTYSFIVQYSTWQFFKLLIPSLENLTLSVNSINLSNLRFATHRRNSDLFTLSPGWRAWTFYKWYQPTFFIILHILVVDRYQMLSWKTLNTRILGFLESMKA